MEDLNSYYVSNKNVYSFFDNERLLTLKHNKFYKFNDWDKKYILNWLDYTNAAIWLTSKGDIQYRISEEGIIHTAPISKINLILSNVIENSVKVTTEHKTTIVRSRATNNSSPYRFPPILYISILDLLLVESDVFDPYEESEFFKKKNLFFRNSFNPTYFLYNNPNKDYIYNESITLQYIYHLTNYDKDKFEYILNWIAIFFKNLSNKTNIALVLLGSKESGKEIFYNEIIKPLFGEEYTIKITNKLLEFNNISKVLKNKLFYNFDNISKSSVEEKKNKELLKNLIQEDELYIENKNELEKINIYGQTLITIDEATVPYIENSDECYSIFKVPQNINEIYIPSNSNGTSRIAKHELIDLIRDDLENFAFILKSYNVNFENFYKPFANDDKDKIQNNIEDKLKAFVNAILQVNKEFFQPIEKSDTALYNELMQDFNELKIKQQNLIKCFNILYKEGEISHSRTLMVKLRELDYEFFKTESIKHGAGGIKYYQLSN